MYITETTDNVRKLIEQLENKDDISKLRFLIYIFGLLNNNQINETNDENPGLNKDDDVKIFTLEDIGFESNACTVFLQHLVMIYNNITKTNALYEDTGNVIGINYSDEENKLIANFEELNFDEKLDVYSEIIIRCDNETCFKLAIVIPMFDSVSNGYDIAKQIKNFKN